MNRRNFMRISATASGGLLLTAHVPAAAHKPNLTGFAPNVFVRIEPDNSVVVTISRIEMGQGLRTALALIVAEELDADWMRLRTETAPLGDAYGPQWSFASASTIMNYPVQRKAGATARYMLMTAASGRWKVPMSELSTEKSQVFHRATGRKLSYGDLAGEAARLPVPSDVPLKDPSRFRLLGRPTPLLHIPAVIVGKAQYGIDVTLPGMLYATIERCPEFRGRLGSYNAAPVQAMPGVRAVVEIPLRDGFYFVNPGIGVVADTYWQALKARRQLTVQWLPGPHAGEHTDGYAQQLREAVGKPGYQTHFDRGNVPSALAAATTPLEAVYELPFLAHTTLEPQNCTVHVDGNRCTIWGPTQDMGGMAGAVSEVLGIPKENVRVNLTLLGGGFGRRIFQDFAIEAALLSKAAGRPVKLIWTREDDLQHDFYRPMAAHRLTAALNADGKPQALLHRIASTPISAHAGARPTDLSVYEAEVGGASNLPYYVPNRRCEYQPVDVGVPRGYWRGVALSQTLFATESFIDELAMTSGQDPVQYRLSLLEGHQLPEHPEGRTIYVYPYQMSRLTNVLHMVAQKAGWGSPLAGGRGRGVACCAFHNAYVGLVAEVEALQGPASVRVRRVVAAVDSGSLINPSAARAQVEGAIVQGLSACLYGQIILRDGRVQQTNFDKYRLLRMAECPVLEVHFVESSEPPTSVGEIALPPVAPAVANALAQATGIRVRKLPLLS